MVVVDEYKQGTYSSITHINNDFQMNTFHMCERVRSIISSLCTFTMLSRMYFKSTTWNMTIKSGNSHGDRGAILVHLPVRGLCAYNAWLLNNDITTIEVSYCRRREFPKLYTVGRGRMEFPAQRELRYNRQLTSWCHIKILWWHVEPHG